MVDDGTGGSIDSSHGGQPPDVPVSFEPGAPLGGDAGPLTWAAPEPGPAGHATGPASAGDPGMGFGPGYPEPAGTAPSPAQPDLPPPGWYAMPSGVTAWWDGAQWQQAAPVAPVAPYQPIGGLATATTVLLLASAAIWVAVSLGDLYRFTLMGRVIDSPGSVSYDDMVRADDLALLVSRLALGALAVTGIVLLIWLHRVYRNLDGALRAGRLEYSAGWAVGWWFVPIANFWKPKQVVNEAWKASDPGSPDPSVPPTHWNDRKPPALLSWWWAAWIIGALVSRSSVIWGSGSDLSPSAESLRTSFLTRSVGAAIYVAAALLAVAVVRSVTQRHEQRARNLAARGGWGA